MLSLLKILLTRVPVFYQPPVGACHLLAISLVPSPTSNHSYMHMSKNAWHWNYLVFAPKNELLLESMVITIFCANSLLV